MTHQEKLKLLSKIKVRSIEECAKSEFYVCSDKRMNPTDHESVCSECNRPVFHHDVFPPHLPQPKKICIPCFMNMAREEQALSE